MLVELTNGHLANCVSLQNSQQNDRHSDIHGSFLER